MGCHFFFHFFIKRCVTHVYFLFLRANMQLSKFFSIMSTLNIMYWLILRADKKRLGKNILNMLVPFTWKQWLHSWATGASVKL